LDSETRIRLGAFLGVFVGMALWEVIAPRRPLGLGRSWRWPNNLGVTAFNAILLRVLMPGAAVAVAAAGEIKHWGLFNNLPPAIDRYLARGANVLLSVILLDLVIYLQHVMFHAVPALWRVHRMHHADLDFDVSTGARFHPLEIAISMVIKIAAVVAIGASPQAVVIFEVVLNATSMFNHGNVRIRSPQTAGFDGCWSRPTCIASITRSSAPRPIATLASTSHGGTAPWAPTAPSPSAAILG